MVLDPLTASENVAAVFRCTMPVSRYVRSVQSRVAWRMPVGAFLAF